MEGRYSLGLLVALTRCTDPAQDDDFNRWYTETHVPDILAFTQGIFHHPIRWRRAKAFVGEDRAGYLATYETDQEDLEAAFDAANRGHFDAERRGRLHPCIEVIHPGSSIYRRIGPEFHTDSGRPVRGILFVIADCTDPDREDEFNRWYDGTHVPDILGTGLFHTAYRLKKVRARPGRGNFLALYETDRDPTEAVEELLGKYRPRWKAENRYVDTLEVRYLAAFERL